MRPKRLLITTHGVLAGAMDEKDSVRDFTHKRDLRIFGRFTALPGVSGLSEFFMLGAYPQTALVGDCQEPNKRPLLR
jgi:hypothetical protein